MGFPLPRPLAEVGASGDLSNQQASPVLNPEKLIRAYST
jgi:hypothetical protein